MNQTSASFSNSRSGKSSMHPHAPPPQTSFASSSALGAGPTFKMGDQVTLWLPYPEGLSWLAVWPVPLLPATSPSSSLQQSLSLCVLPIVPLSQCLSEFTMVEGGGAANTNTSSSKSGVDDVSLKFMKIQGVLMEVRLFSHAKRGGGEMNLSGSSSSSTGVDDLFQSVIGASACQQQNTITTSENSPQQQLDQQLFMAYVRFRMEDDNRNGAWVPLSLLTSTAKVGGGIGNQNNISSSSSSSSSSSAVPLAILDAWSRCRKEYTLALSSPPSSSSSSSSAPPTNKNSMNTNNNTSGSRQAALQPSLSSLAKDAEQKKSVNDVDVDDAGSKILGGSQQQQHCHQQQQQQQQQQPLHQLPLRAIVPVVSRVPYDPILNATVGHMYVEEATKRRIAEEEEEKERGRRGVGGGRGDANSTVTVNNSANAPNSGAARKRGGDGTVTATNPTTPPAATVPTPPTAAPPFTVPIVMDIPSPLVEKEHNLSSPNSNYAAASSFLLPPHQQRQHYAHVHPTFVASAVYMKQCSDSHALVDFLETRLGRDFRCPPNQCRYFCYLAVAAAVAGDAADASPSSSSSSISFLDGFAFPPWYYSPVRLLHGGSLGMGPMITTLPQPPQSQRQHTSAADDDDDDHDAGSDDEGGVASSPSVVSRSNQNATTSPSSSFSIVSQQNNNVPMAMIGGLLGVDLGSDAVGVAKKKRRKDLQQQSAEPIDTKMNCGVDVNAASPVNPFSSLPSSSPPAFLSTDQTSLLLGSAIQPLPPISLAAFAAGEKTRKGKRERSGGDDDHSNGTNRVKMEDEEGEGGGGGGDVGEGRVSLQFDSLTSSHDQQQQIDQRFAGINKKEERDGDDDGGRVKLETSATQSLPPHGLTTEKKKKSVRFEALERAYTSAAPNRLHLLDLHLCPFTLKLFAAAATEEENLMMMSDYRRNHPSSLSSSLPPHTGDHHHRLHNCDFYSSGSSQYDAFLDKLMRIRLERAMSIAKYGASTATTTATTSSTTTTPSPSSSALPPPPSPPSCAYPLCPPGTEIYRDERQGVSVYFIPGGDHRPYARNLFLLAKSFLENKLVGHDVGLYNCYVVALHTRRHFPRFHAMLVSRALKAVEAMAMEMEEGEGETDGDNVNQRQQLNSKKDTEGDTVAKKRQRQQRMRLAEALVERASAFAGFYSTEEGGAPPPTDAAATTAKANGAQNNSSSSSATVYNLACIMSLPCFGWGNSNNSTTNVHHKHNNAAGTSPLLFASTPAKGIGSFIIRLSYEIAYRKGFIGTPERPLSDLGERAYRSYWRSQVLGWMRKVVVLREAALALMDTSREGGGGGGGGGGECEETETSQRRHALMASTYAATMAELFPFSSSSLAKNNLLAAGRQNHSNSSPSTAPFPRSLIGSRNGSSGTLLPSVKKNANEKHHHTNHDATTSRTTRRAHHQHLSSSLSKGGVAAAAQQKERRRLKKKERAARQMGKGRGTRRHGGGGDDDDGYVSLSDLDDDNDDDDDGASSISSSISASSSSSSVQALEAPPAKRNLKVGEDRTERDEHEEDEDDGDANGNEYPANTKHLILRGVLHAGGGGEGGGGGGGGAEPPQSRRPQGANDGTTFTAAQQQATILRCSIEDIATYIGITSKDALTILGEMGVFHYSAAAGDGGGGVGAFRGGGNATALTMMLPADMLMPGALPPSSLTYASFSSPSHRLPPQEKNTNERNTAVGWTRSSEVEGQSKKKTADANDGVHRAAASTRVASNNNNTNTNGQITFDPRCFLI